MTLKHIFAIGLILVGPAACTGASHIPPPWEIPGAVIGTTIGNARYEAKRNKVKTALTENYGYILQELRMGQGPYFTHACSLARVASADCINVHQEIISNPDIYLSRSPDENIESMTVAIMVHGN